MTTEPPKGLKSNMKRLYNIVTEEKLNNCRCQEKFRKLVFSLCWFHAIILERKKFRRLGWNVEYSFNDADFEASFRILQIYLDDYETTPWDALKYLIAAVMYGGHVTDDWDKRLLMTYINQYFNDEVLTTKNYKLSSLTYYYTPEDASVAIYRDIINEFPTFDQPQAFGQHPNADIASLIIESKGLCRTMLTLQDTAEYDDSAKESKVLNLASDMLSKLPSQINYEDTYGKMGPNKTPLQIVLLQEIQRYNILLKGIELSLVNLQKGIKGILVMSPDLENIFECLYAGRIPHPWLKAYPSLLSLGSWSRDLIYRVEHFNRWAMTLQPPVAFWLSAFTFPTGFLTAVLQTAARKEGITVDLLVWEFVPQDQQVVLPPEDGVYVRGMYLEGASWNKKELAMMEPSLMELFCPLPVIQFRPVVHTSHKPKGMYVCPVYYYPQRSGTQDRDAFVVAVELKVGEFSSEFWVKRGTAILLSLSH